MGRIRLDGDTTHVERGQFVDDIPEQCRTGISMVSLSLTHRRLHSPAPRRRDMETILPRYQMSLDPGKSGLPVFAARTILASRQDQNTHRHLPSVTPKHRLRPWVSKTASIVCTPQRGNHLLACSTNDLPQSTRMLRYLPSGPFRLTIALVLPRLFFHPSGTSGSTALRQHAHSTFLGQGPAGS